MNSIWHVMITLLAARPRNFLILPKQATSKTRQGAAISNCRLPNSSADTSSNNHMRPTRPHVRPRSQSSRCPVSGSYSENSSRRLRCVPSIFVSDDRFSYSIASSIGPEGIRPFEGMTGIGSVVGNGLCEWRFVGRRMAIRLLSGENRSVGVADVG